MFTIFTVTIKMEAFKHHTICKETVQYYKMLMSGEVDLISSDSCY